MNKQDKSTKDLPITMASQAAGYLREDLTSLDHEEAWALFLNASMIPLTKKMITVGTIKATPIDHRRIIKTALDCNATALILFHNHPSGNPRPSASDISETDKLRKACEIFDISLVDHIIIGENSFFSFSDESQNNF